MKKCQYCDFLSFQADEHTQHEYVEALLREIAYYGARCQDYTITSIYIGGGTPSWLDEELTLRIMDAVRCSFLLAQDAEISIECNPGTVTDGKFALPACRHQPHQHRITVCGQGGAAAFGKDSHL